MSECSEESIGLCLSEDGTKLTISDETGEARTNKSISVESLSLTKISAANTGVFTSEHQPVLITVPFEEDNQKPAKMYEKAPNLLSVSHHNTSTSGVTPSATTLEGTLDDIPDFQEMLPLTSVVVTKKDQEIADSKSPESSPAKDSNQNQSSSPLSGLQLNAISKERFLTSEAKFMQEVKRQNTTKPTSSIKSFASTTAPKTSTSGITVVEVKPPMRPQDGRATGSDLSKLTNPDHSIGSIKSDTMTNISASVSSTSLSSRPSEMTVFKNFNTDWSLKDKPFLLHVPNEEESEINHSHQPRYSRKVLGDLKAPNNNRKSKSVKNWDTLETKSRSVSSNSNNASNKSESSTSYETASKKRRKKHVINNMNENGIKQIVKEEMTAVVSMQNEIWHKILDSFVEKALKGNGNLPHTEAPTLKSTPEKLVMLQLPKDEPEVFYKPLKIPIVKSADEMTKHAPPLLHFPAENESSNKNPVPCNIENDEKSTDIVENETAVAVASYLDVSIQTTDPVAKRVEFVEVGIQSDVEIETIQLPSQPKSKRIHGTENLPIKQNFMKPPCENPDYQRAVNKQEMPLRVMEECKMLLESIQNSAQELKDLKKDTAAPSKPLNALPQEQKFVPSREEKHDSLYIKSKHEIFLEKFFNDQPGKNEGKASRFLDIVDLPQGTSSSGHFDLLRRSSQTRKPSEFIHSTDIIDPRRTKSNEKRSKVEKDQKHKKEPRHKKKHKDITSAKTDDGLRTKDVFVPKSEIARSPIPSLQEPPVHDEPTSPRTRPKRSDHDLIPQAPPSPGEVSEYKSQSMSSIGKYLSQADDKEISVSDKTIENQEPVSDNDESLSEVPSETPEIQLAKYHSTPEKDAPDNQFTPGSEVDSKSSSEPYQPKAIDPSQFSQFIEENLSKIKQAYGETQLKEADRLKKISMLLQNRNTAQSGTTPAPFVTKPTPVRPSPRLKSDTVTLIKPSKLLMEPSQPDESLLVRQSSKTSVVSSDTSLPTNTDDLLKAALDSDSTLPPDPPLPPNSRPSKMAAVKPQKQSIPKKSAHNYDKQQLEKWMQEKRKARMLNFRKERDEKIKQEPRPYQRPKAQPQPTPQKNEFDRKAAVLRRLNMAEELFNDIQKTPKPAVPKTGQVKDRTTEWVQGLNIEEFDSIHSQTFTSEHGASEITAGISLP